MRAKRVASKWRDRAAWGALAAAGLIASTPVIGAAHAAFAKGYIPVGDDAVIAIRSGDVWSTQTPLLGMPSGTEAWTGIASHHPGPLLFWLFSPFVEILGQRAGLIVGVAAIGLASILGIAVAVLRQRGPIVAAVVLLGVPIVYESAGGADLFHKPLNPAAVFLPFVCYLVLSWAIARGERLLTPWWALTGTVAVQAELAYLPVVLGVGVATTVIAFGAARPVRSAWTRIAGIDWTSPSTVTTVTLLSTGFAAQLLVAFALDDGIREAFLLGTTSILIVGGTVRTTRRQTGQVRARTTTIGVLALLWAPALLESLLSVPGNPGALARAGTTAVDTQGLSGAWEAVRAALSAPLGLFVDGIEEPVLTGSSTYLAVVAAVVLATLATSHRLRTRRSTLVVGAALVASGLAAGRIVDEGSFDPLYLLWLVPVAALCWATVVDGTVTAVSNRSLIAGRLAAAAAAAVLLVGAGSIVARPWPYDLDEWSFADEPAVRELAPLLGEEVARSGSERILVASGGSPLLKLLSIGLMADLEERGAVAVATDNIVNYLGDQRSARIGTTDHAVWVLEEPVPHPPPGSELIVRLSPEANEVGDDVVQTLGADIAAFVQSQGGIDLGDDPAFDLRSVEFGRQAGVCPIEVSSGYPCWDDRTGIDLSTLDERVLLDLYRAGLVDGPRLSDDLQSRVDRTSTALEISLWLGPPPDFDRWDRSALPR